MKITAKNWDGFEVYIETNDGTHLPEHRITHHAATDKEPQTSKVFIEYKDGQEFQICVANSTWSRVKVRIGYSVDGRRLLARCGVATPKNILIRSESFEKIKGKLVINTLRFKPLERCNTGHSVDKTVEEQLGTICVNLEQGSTTQSGWELPSATRPPRTILNWSVKPDRLNSYIGGDNNVPAVPQLMVDWTPKSDVPPYKVIFYYYTREMLLDMNVIPDSNKIALQVVPEEVQKKQLDIYNHHEKETSASSDSGSTASSSLESAQEEKRKATLSWFSRLRAKTSNKNTNSLWSRLSCNRQSGKVIQ